jgi:hypothetical protein
MNGCQSLGSCKEVICRGKTQSDVNVWPQFGHLYVNKWSLNFKPLTWSGIPLTQVKIEMNDVRKTP